MDDTCPSVSSAPAQASQPAPVDAYIPAGQSIPPVHQSQQHTFPQPSLSSWQQPGYTQPSSYTLLHRLTQGLAADKTDPSTATVKVSQPLQSDGLNLPVWLYDLINCGISKNCVEAFKDPIPGTKANSAAINLLTSSTPGEFHWEITACPSACDALS